MPASEITSTFDRPYRPAAIAIANRVGRLLSGVGIGGILPVLKPMEIVMNKPPTYAETFFRLLTDWPKTILLLSLLCIVGLGSFMPQLHKDTSSGAFIADDDPVAPKNSLTRTLNNPVVPFA